MYRLSLPRLLSSYTSTFHLRHFSAKPVERLRHIWISGLIDPNYVGPMRREMLYTGQIDDPTNLYSREISAFDLIYEPPTNLVEGIVMRPKLPILLMRPRLPTKTQKKSKRPLSRPNTKLFVLVQTPIISFNRKDYQINIFDTPHTDLDFTNQFNINNALHAFGGAVLVLSGVSGVNSESIHADKQMIKYELPRLVFINMLDEKGANPWDVLNQARSKLQHRSAAIQVPIGLEDEFKGLVDLVQLKAYSFPGSNRDKVVIEEVPTHLETLVYKKRRELINVVSEVDDKLAEAFCTGKAVSAADLEEAIRRATIAQRFIPVFMGSTFKSKGLQLLLDGVLNYLPCPIKASDYALDQSKDGKKDTLVAMAFTLKNKFRQITYLRIYEGVLEKGGFMTDVNTGRTFEVPRLLGLHNERVIPKAHPGEIIIALDNGSDGFTNGLARYTRLIYSDGFTNGLARYTRTPSKVSESFS